MNDDWAALVRQFLAHRDPVLLVRAIEMAQSRQIVDLLKAFQEGDFATVDRLNSLCESFQSAGSVDALTVSLIHTDCWARLVESYSEFPSDRQTQALQIGLENCDHAILIAARLNEQSCVALYQSLKGTGLDKLGELEAARQAYQESLRISRRLTEAQPTVYVRVVAITLIKLGSVLTKLRELEAARQAYQEALQISRRLAEAQPNVYLPDIAWTLNNLGNVLKELDELEAARQSYREALQISRRLAEAQPNVYLRVVAVTLNNLGTVLRQLRELEAARQAHQEALQICRRLAEAQPNVYLSDVAITLNNLGIVMRQVRELEAARQAHQEAVLICRRLAEAQPNVYLSDVAMTLNNLGAVLWELRELEAAHQAFQETLPIYRRLAEAQPNAYLQYVAGTLNSLGNVLNDLRELEAARQSYQEALRTYRRLAEAQPNVYLSDVAMTLNNLGTVLRELRELEAARQAHQEAVLICRRLAEAQPNVYLSDVAIRLINLGPVLRELRELEAARQAYQEALLILRQLAEAQPNVYLPHVAVALNGLGNVMTELREMEAARQAFQEAIELTEQFGLQLDGSLACYNWGSLEDEAENHQQALELFESCVELCERGLSQLAEREHRDLFKGKIEHAYLRLIEHYARLAANNGMTTRRRLVGLMESQRRVETLAELGQKGANDGRVTWLATFDDMMSSTGRLSDLFRERRCAFLWMHATRGGVVFVILTPERCEVAVADQGLLDKFWELFGEVEQAMAAFQTRNPMLVEAVKLTRSAVAAHIPSAGEAVFNCLPAAVKALLAGDDFETVFLAPCSATMNLPFEMLKAPADQYVGLRKMMPRVHGLAELEQVIKRQPGLSGARKALVVGNPPHDGAPPLQHAETRAVALASELRQRGYGLVPNDGALLNHHATEQAVLNGLAHKPILWVHNGHGDLLTLLLSGGDRLTSHTVARQQWEHNPVVHNDCCRSGAAIGRGGGRFDGLPTAALMAGASCVLSSVQAVWDDTAKEFSERLYGKALDARKGLTVCDALLQTRREMAEEYHDNPLIWATTVLWGNPWVRLA